MRDIVAAGARTYAAFAPPGWEPPADLLDAAPHVEAIESPSMEATVAVQEGRIVGLLTIIDAATRPSPLDGTLGDWYLRHIFVAESHWGTGVARALMLEALRPGEGRLITPARQARARRFYEREGWTCAGEFDNERFGMPTAEYRRSGPH